MLLIARARIFSFLMPFLFVAGAVQAQQREAEVSAQAGIWTAHVNGMAVYAGPDMVESIQTAMDYLTPHRSWKETVNVRSSGSTGSHTWDGDLKVVEMRSNTILDFHGNTMHVNDDEENVIVPVRGIRANNIEVRNLRITGNPRYGIWLQGCANVRLSQIEVSIPETRSSTGPGLGVRIQERSTTWSRNVEIDRIFVEEAKGHAVEFWRTDGLTIGTVQTRNTGGCGLLLNETTNAHIGTVDSYRANHGGGYAAFRTANNAGPNITVDSVIARECGRGVFFVSGSRGVTVNQVDIARSSSHGILVEDTQDAAINGGVIADCGAEGVRITSRALGQGPGADHHPTQNVLVQNLRVSSCSYGIRETLPRTNHNRIFNNDLQGNGTCLTYDGEGTVAAGNVCAGGVRMNDLYEAWIYRAFPELASSPAAAPAVDPRGEGVPNLVRYALDLDADPARGSLPVPTMEGDRLSIRFLRDPGKSDIAYVVEGSSDLSDWSDVLYDSRVNTRSNNEGDYRRVYDRLTVAETGGRRALRLRVERVP